MSKVAAPVPNFTGKQKLYYDRLIQAREAVVNRMKFHSEEALDCSNADKRGVTTHMADISSDNSLREMGLRLLTEEGNVVELIEAAIGRLVDGTYGKCSDCQELISEARLEARPYALYCIKCKSAREKGGRF